MSSPRAHDAVSLELAGAQLGVKIWDNPILRLLICRYSMPSTLNNILQTSSDAFRTAVTVRYHEVDYATCSRIDHSNHRYLLYIQAVRCLIVPVNQLRLVLHAATYPNLKVIEVALGIEFKMVITLERSGFADIRATAEITEKHWGSRCRKVIATGLLDNVLTCIPPQWNTKTYFTAYTDLDGKSFSRTGFWAQPISDLYLFGHDPIDNERMFGQLRPEDNIHSIMMNLVLDSALLEALGSLLDTLEAKGVKRIGIACGGGIDAVKHALVAMDKFDPRKRWFDGFHTVAIILHEIDWNGNGRVVTELSLGFIQGMFRTRPAPEATRHPSIVEVVVDPCQPDTYKRIFDPLEQPKILRFIAEVAPVLLWVGGPLLIIGSGSSLRMTSDHK